MKGWDTKTHQKLINTLAVDVDGLSEIKIWLQRFKNGDFECRDLPRAGSSALTLGPLFESFLPKYPFASAGVIAKHFLPNADPVNEILQRELGMSKFSRRWVSHSLSLAHRVARVDAFIEMLRILQESEANDFDEIGMGDEFWFQSISASSQMFVCSPADANCEDVTGTRCEKIMITRFSTARKLIGFDVMPKRRKDNKLCFVENRVPDLKKGKTLFKSRKPESTFWVHADNSMRYHGAKIVSKFQKHRLLRMPDPRDSPDISRCDFWLFAMLKGSLKDPVFTPSDEIEAARVDLWNHLTVDDVQSIFPNRMRRLTWVIENGSEKIQE
jgi:hypothetical protein